MKRKLVIFILSIFAGVAILMETAPAQEEATGTAIRIIAGDITLSAVLDDNKTAREFIATLPRTLPMQRLFNREYYTVLPTALSKDGKTQESYELGDIAFWTSGDYFGLLYSYERPKLSSPIIVIGKITSDLAIFNTLDRTMDMRFEIVK